MDKANPADAHLEPEILAAYAEGRLDAAELDSVQSHIVACGDCAAVVLDLSSSIPGIEISKARRELSWQKLHGELEAAGALTSDARPATNVLAFNPKAEKRVVAPIWRVWALAATILLALNLYFTAGLFRKLEQARKPQIEPPIISLIASEELRSGTLGRPQRLHLRRNQRAWLSLSTTFDSGPRLFRVVFKRSSDGRVVWLAAGEKTESRSIRLELTLQQVGTGLYEIDLEMPGVGEDSWERKATYLLEVVEDIER